MNLVILVGLHSHACTRMSENLNAVSRVISHGLKYATNIKIRSLYYILSIWKLFEAAERIIHCGIIHKVVCFLFLCIEIDAILFAALCLDRTCNVYILASVSPRKKQPFHCYSLESSTTEKALNFAFSFPLESEISNENIY